MEKKDAALSLVKGILQIVTGIGTAALCGSFASSIAENGGMKNAEKACAGVAGAVVGSMLGDAASDYIERTVDQIVKTVETVKEAWTAIKKEDVAE